jgi:hypothetical protein
VSGELDALFVMVRGLITGEAQAELCPDEPADDDAPAPVRDPREYM